MKNKAEIIQNFINKFSFKKYLEIGIGVKKETWDEISCDKKIGIDPDPFFCDYVSTENDRIHNLYSEDFFSSNHDKFDIIYIDGDHKEKSVFFDLKESLKILNNDGIIFMHDVGPQTNEQTNLSASGTAYIAWMKLINQNEETEIKEKLYHCSYIFDDLDVIGILWKSNKENKISLDEEYNWENYEKNMGKILNYKNIDEIVSLYREEKYK